jgi:NADPH:quinone reductase-like Zn-dependent oxidoreductase
MTTELHARPTLKADPTTNDQIKASAKTTMKAAVYHRFGPPEQIRIADIARPVVDDDGVLVRVLAASINALDWRSIEGRPAVARVMGMGLRKPKRSIPSLDLAGRVEAVGKNVTEFKPGDEVIGNRINACAEYVLGKERHFVMKPARLTFEQAAAVPVAGMTALEALQFAKTGPGQRVLINGAAGGVGTFAVQIAKALGADVTAVCSTRNVDMVRALGADRVIDYTKEDFTRSGIKHDVMLDVAGNRSLSDSRRALTRDGTLLIIGGNDGFLLGPITRMAQALVTKRFVSQKMIPFISQGSKDGMVKLTELIEAGKLTPVVERTYPLSETAAAIRYVRGGHAKAKIVVTM